MLPKYNILRDTCMSTLRVSLLCFWSSWLGTRQHWRSRRCHPPLMAATPLLPSYSLPFCCFKIVDCWVFASASTVWFALAISLATTSGSRHPSRGRHYYWVMPHPNFPCLLHWCILILLIVVFRAKFVSSHRKKSVPTSGTSQNHKSQICVCTHKNTNEMWEQSNKK